MSFSVTYWATVNTSDGTITGTGQTDADNNPTVPTGSVVVSADNHATIVAAQSDGFQCKLISGVVRIMTMPVPAPVDLDAVKNAAYVTIDTDAELARASFLTPGSGQSLEYQQTAANAQALVDLLAAAQAAALAAQAVVGTVAAMTAPPRAGTADPAPAVPAAQVPPIVVSPTPAAINPADYPWLVAEQNALAAIGITVALPQVANAVVATMKSWDVSGSAIKQVRRKAKLQVSVATTPAEISAVIAGLVWPSVSDLAVDGVIPST